MSKAALHGDTIVKVGKGIPLYAYRAYFQEATGRELPGAEFQNWLNTQAGKTLDEAVATYGEASERRSMGELLSEGRFDIISGPDKAFILAFDTGIEALGYDFGGGIGDGYCWGKYMIIYAKTGVKNKKVAARIFIREDGITLRLFLNEIDKHGTYLEHASEHIREVLTGDHGACSCEPKKEGCRMRKTYTLGGRRYEKCSGVVFEFQNPTVEKCADYIGLLEAFYPVKKSRAVK